MAIFRRRGAQLDGRPHFRHIFAMGRQESETDRTLTANTECEAPGLLRRQLSDRDSKGASSKLQPLLSLLCLHYAAHISGLQEMRISQS